MHRPSWFVDDSVVVSGAPTCGINKDGIDAVDVGDSKQITVDDTLFRDVEAIRAGDSTETTSVVPLDDVLKPWRAVPTHFDYSSVREFETFVEAKWPEWETKSLGDLIDEGKVFRRDGHGSPPKEDRVGQIPYIKVSDLRAGMVNINPSNMLPLETAKAFWKKGDPGLRAFDLISPERASANIGQFCVLMPGQESVVITREVIILRALPKADFDAFFLMWALSLRVVRAQWQRVIFMQTNREDVGHRYREILIPVPPTAAEADAVSADFRKFYTEMAGLRADFAKSVAQEGLHNVHLDSVIPINGDETTERAGEAT
jgi:hypothetical protein